MERELEGWRTGGMDVWQLSTKQKTKGQEVLSEVWKFGGQEGRLVNDNSLSEIPQEQQTDNDSFAYSPIRLSTETVLLPYRPNALSPENSHTSIPPYLYTSVITVVLAIFLASSPIFAEDMPMSALVTPTNVEFKICTKNYVMPEEKLFYMAIASARANNFEVNEIQSKTGYILFTAVGKQYLASVVKIDSKTTMLKITPVNNNYFFAPGIVLNFFKYIDINGATPIIEIPKV